MWLTLYPNMDKKNFVPFSKFYKKAIKPQIKKPELSKEEIISIAESIKKHHQLAK
jgi:hypothetical protein